MFIVRVNLVINQPKIQPISLFGKEMMDMDGLLVKQFNAKLVPNQTVHLSTKSWPIILAVHDKVFNYSDYDVPYGYMFHGYDAVIQKCVECNCEFDASKGMGHEYLPEMPIESVRGSLEVLFCRDCFKERRKYHNEYKPIPKEKLARYFPEHSAIFLASS